MWWISLGLIIGEQKYFYELHCYVLQGDGGKLYKGRTNNLTRRLSEHKSGKTITTKRMRHLKVVYTEEYDTLEKARSRESYLKSAAGKRFLKRIWVGSSIGRAGRS